MLPAAGAIEKDRCCHGQRPGAIHKALLRRHLAILRKFAHIKKSEGGRRQPAEIELMPVRPLFEPDPVDAGGGTERQCQNLNFPQSKQNGSSSVLGAMPITRLSRK